MATIVRSRRGPKRSALPQIPKDRIAEFARYLQTLSYPERRDMGHNGMGNQYNVGRVSDVAVTANKLAVKHLKPTQSEFNAEKVQSMLQNIEKFKNDIFFVSQDDKILDGHHRWAALKQDNPDQKVRVIRADIPIEDLIQAALEFSPEREDITEVIKLRDLILEEVKPVSLDSAKRMAAHLGVESEVDIEQFRMGLEVEQEHMAPVQRLTKDPKQIIVTVARIALDHLRELPDYYTRLDKMEKVTTR